jgi:hypothetical protein
MHKAKVAEERIREEFKVYGNNTDAKDSSQH